MRSLKPASPNSPNISHPITPMCISRHHACGPPLLTGLERARQWYAVVQMKFCCSLILLLLMTTIACAQQWRTTDYKNNIHFSLSTLSADNPGFEFGYERKYARFSSLVSYAFITDALAQPLALIAHDREETVFENYGGYLFSLEQRYYITKPKTIVQLYGGLFTSWLRSSYTTSELYERPDRRTYTDTFTIHKSNWVLSPRIGVQVKLGRFLADGGLGFGIKHRQISHENRDFPEDKFTDRRWFRLNLIPRETKEIDELTLSIPINIRIAFQF